METKTVERNWGLDLLRILAAFTVVMLHVSPQAYLDVEIASAPWNVMNAITGLCCWNVSAFFMLSGAFLLAPQKAMSTRTLYRKNIARLAAAFVFWSAVYALTYCLLRGKGKVTYTPHADCGDNVIVINAGKAILTGNKMEQKYYRTHSGWVGGLKETKYRLLMQEKPEVAVRVAVRGMMPRNIVTKDSLKRLHIYAGEQHEHQAQKPELVK